MQLSNNQEAFLALVRAGLWEKDVQLSQFGEIDFQAIYRLAKEQSVVGLVTAGFEHVADVKIPRDIALAFARATMQLEQRNMAMNSFLVQLFDQMREKNIYSLLVKGQGIAQCYERPLWRASGDVDLFLDAENYEKAKEWISSLGRQVMDEIEGENFYKKHIAFYIDNWEIELHGTLRGDLGETIDQVIDEIQEDTFNSGNVRTWRNGETDIFIPSPDNDLIFVFAHIIKHFFRGGIGLRQICDWCRLLWTFRDSLDIGLLESRLKRMGLMTEWHAFATLGVDLLGMPIEAMPLYSSDRCWKKKSIRILEYVTEVGNFGNNRDHSYKRTSSFLKRMTISLSYRTNDFISQVRVFPFDAIRAYMHLWKNGMNVVERRIKK